MGLNIALEIIGVLLLVVLVRQCGLSNADRRRDFMRTGVLSSVSEAK
jgi:hypothetical protein